MKRLLLLVMGAMSCLAPSRSLQAQFLPASSNAVLYFAHLADGGPSSQQWKTVFRFVNPITITNLPVTGKIWFYDQLGNPLPLDFGNGPVTSLQVSIPSQGAIQLQTTGASPALRVGSVVAAFDSPVLGVEEFQSYKNGVFYIGASVNAPGLSYGFETFADKYTGIAVANPSTTTIYCSGSLLDANGNNLAGNTFTLPPLGQAAFTLVNVFSLASLSPGSYSLSCQSQPNAYGGSLPAPFVALAIAGNAQGITSSMPPGNYALPSDSYRMIWNAFNQLVKALNSVSSLQVGHPSLQISQDQVINAQFDSATNTVTINLALVELLADSPSEVAFVIAHELGHAHQFVSGATTFNSNPELDADEFALFGLLLTGYDAYAGGGALGKLMMALQATGLVAQLWENQYDPHTSFPNRMSVIMSEIQAVCSLPQAASLCQTEHNLFHPNLPTVSTPLAVRAH